MIALVLTGSVCLAIGFVAGVIAMAYVASDPMGMP